ncbi:glycosyltransferase family 2 protein [Pseudomonas solani]|uniref:glycosyltransferase family 2 protein n=1 Tax=Pseudomonas solani TaxID=2731552 RepID=UPI003D6B579A
MLLQAFDASMPNSLPPQKKHTLPHEGHVAILLCTYNGEKFLPQQLKSFEQQTHRNWSLYISDDGSQDQTEALLQHYAKTWGEQKIEINEGPQAGFVRNFLSLTCRADIYADYFAWSDQDDIWDKEKLEVAIKWLNGIPSNVPALYCGRTQIICENGTTLGMSPIFPYPPHFKNALVQSIAGGNTMVFNKAAKALIMEAGYDLDIPSHDWWLYQIVSGSNGAIYYDPKPRVLYRQHKNNVVGSNSDWRARMQRLSMVFQGRFHEWNNQNIRALESMSHCLSEEHRQTLALFKKARQQCLPARAINILRSGLYRQTIFGNLGLFLATIARKI